MWNISSGSDIVEHKLEEVLKKQLSTVMAAFSVLPTLDFSSGPRSEST